MNNCARTTGHDGVKKCLDQFYWLASDYRSLNCLNLGRRFNQQFTQAGKALTSTDMCNSLKFRHLKEFSKNALIVKRSLIHGRGLFTLVDLNQGQMIIEYAGEIIRNELCDRREKYYESKVNLAKFCIVSSSGKRAILKKLFLVNRESAATCSESTSTK